MNEINGCLKIAFLHAHVFILGCGIGSFIRIGWYNGFCVPNDETINEASVNLEFFFFRKQEGSMIHFQVCFTSV